MKRYIILCFLVLSSSHLFAGSWAAGLAGAAEAGQNSLRREAEAEREAAMMLRRHELEMQRMTREYELISQQQRQLREQAEKYAKEQRQAEVQREALRAENETRNREAWLRQIEDAHPGWFETYRSASFLTWRAKQPEFVQKLGLSERSEDIILMFDLYKRDLKPHKTASKKTAK